MFPDRSRKSGVDIWLITRLQGLFFLKQRPWFWTFLIGRKILPVSTNVHMFWITQLFLNFWNLYVNLFVSKIDSTHLKHSPILWNACIKSEFMAISFAWTWKSSEFDSWFVFPVLPGSSPVGNPSEPYHPELPWALIGCWSDAAKVVLIMFSSRVATRWSEEGGSYYLK